MRCSIVAIGNELVCGATQDTNSAHLARLLTRAGVEMVGFHVIADVIDRIAHAVTDAAAEADLVLVSGGLGPTLDDVTREGVAEAAGVGLYRDEEILEALRERFITRYHYDEMPESNARQGLFPKGCEIIPNPVGTASGFRIRIGQAEVAVMPGVPSELEAMFEESILPRIARAEAVERQLHVYGMGESRIQDRLGELIDPCGNPSVGSTPSNGIVTIRILAVGLDDAAARVEAIESAVREELGEAVFGADGETLHGVVARELLDRGMTVAIAESCTGGLISQQLTEIPGVSAAFRGNVVAYANEAKIEMLGVPARLLATHGAVSEETAGAMAEGALERFGSDIAVSTTGIAGPSGGTDDKPVGLVCFGLARRGRATETRRATLAGDRQSIRLRAAREALNLLRMRIQTPE